MMNAERVAAITNLTAFVGDRFEPLLVDLEIGEDGSIAALRPVSLGQSTAERADNSGGITLDGSGLLAFPGLIDCHDHFRNLTPGLPVGEGLRLDELLRVLWSLLGQQGTAEYHLGALLGCLQRLKTGITTVVDHCYTYHAPGLEEATLTGYEASGVRWFYARGIMTRPYEPICEDWPTAERRIRELVASGRVPPARLAVAPVSIRQATGEEFARSSRLADELGCGLHTHVAETAGERGFWEQECGSSPIRALDQAGFLTPRTLLAHCVFLDDGEIEILAQRGSHVIHCPSSHLKGAKGFTRVPDLLAAGVNVALGVDMMADLLSEMRTEIGMHAAHRQDPNAVPKLEALRMATQRGARALGQERSLGLIEVGRTADLVLLEGRSLLQAPLIDPVYTLLYATHPGQVRHVLVDGKLVVRDGRSTLIDEAALLAEVESVVAAYLRRVGYGEHARWLGRA
jgi:5-methylthioadenosine/S-adenosylhomocysteine deaminase